MKCIKMFSSGSIQRVKDGDAANSVAGKLAAYVSKSEWKQAGRP